jgi:hypothetical protein
MYKRRLEIWEKRWYNLEDVLRESDAFGKRVLRDRF